MAEIDGFGSQCLSDYGKFSQRGNLWLDVAITASSRFSSLKPCEIIVYYVYVLKSKKDGNFYVGYTGNLRNDLLSIAMGTLGQLGTDYLSSSSTMKLQGLTLTPYIEKNI